MSLTFEKVVDRLKNGVAFFDFDGVLSKYQTLDDRTMLYPDEKWVKYCVEHDDVFKHGGPSSRIQRAIKELDPDKVYVLSVAETSFEQKHKINFIHEYFKTIKDENIFFVSKNEYKKIIIDAIHSKHYSNMSKSKMCMVEDSLSVIMDIEQTTDFSAIHVSCFL